MAQQDISNGPLLTLLTDALRAGPGSPEWRDAIATLKASGPEAADEYRVLIEAREALESGKDYRSVRAGPGFTRKVLTRVNEEPTVRRPFPTATVIAVLAGAAILAALAVVGYELYPRGQVAQGSKAISDLASTYFSTDVLSTTFDHPIPMNWREIGSLPVVAADGLTPGNKTPGEGGAIGGGVVTVDSLPADQPFALQATLRVDAQAADLIPQVFVSGNPEFSPDRAISDPELVWQLKGSDQSVVVVGNVERTSSVPEKTRTLTVRITLDRDLAIVECDGHRLWAGPNHLGDKPRYVGVRFLRTGGKSAGRISVQSVRVQKS